MWSRIPNEARPVRMEAISCCKSPRAFSMRVLMFPSTSFTELNVGPLGAACGSVFISGSPKIRLVNQSSDGLAHRHTHYIASRVQIENDNRQPVIAAHGDRGCVHY